MKTILVTGGAGFIGSHLVEVLLQRGHHVIVLDNFFTGQPSNLTAAAAADIQGVARREVGRLEIVRGDVCDPMHFEVDEIFHLACPASPVHYQRNPVRTIKTCVQGTLHALELARETEARILIASTSEVYGDPLVHPQVESYLGNVNPVGPRSCYDEGKRCAESLAFSFATQFDVEVRLARIFNCYGPRMAADDGRVVSNFIVQALRGEPLTIYGDGKQTRSFIYVDDLVAGLVRLMSIDQNDLCVDNTKDIGQIPALPVNLGNPGEFSIAELAEEVQRQVGVVGFERRELPKDDPCRRRPDITRAQKLLDWNPKIQLREGLERTIAYFRAALRK